MIYLHGDRPATEPRLLHRNFTSLLAVQFYMLAGSLSKLHHLNPQMSVGITDIKLFIRLFPATVLTSFGGLCCGALTGVLGLAAETGLVKTESRPGMWRPDLVISLPPDFHWVLWKRGHIMSLSRKQRDCFHHSVAPLWLVLTCSTQSSLSA